jgi:hypothetical protein
MTPQRDPVLAAVERVERQVKDLRGQVLDHEKKLRWIMYVAVMVVGAVGGPDAVQVVTGGGV